MYNQKLEFEKKVICYNNATLDLLLKLIEPLLTNFNIKNFSYIKFVDNKVIRISNNICWNTYHIEKKLYDINPYQDIISDMQNNTSKFKFWNDNSKLVQNMQEHDFWHSMSIIKKFDNYIEVYNFGIKKDCCDPVDFYLNHLKHLERFIVYFKSKTISLLSTMEKDYYLIRTNKIITANIQGFLENESNNYKFLEMTILDKLNFDKLSLSKREAECMYLLYYNNTIKSIARKLSLSPRTVETYINQAKLKLDNVKESDQLNDFYKNIVNYYELTISS